MILRFLANVNDTTKVSDDTDKTFVSGSFHCPPCEPRRAAKRFYLARERSSAAMTPRLDNMLATKWS